MEHVVTDCRTKAVAFNPFTSDEIAAVLSASVMTIAQLKAYASQKRRAVIDAGTTVIVATVPISTWTDTQSQSAITALVLGSQLNPLMTTAWKGRDGVFYPLDASGILALGLAIAAFVQAAFSIERSVSSAIDGLQITTREHVDLALWPSTL